MTQDNQTIDLLKLELKQEWLEVEREFLESKLQAISARNLEVTRST